MCVKNKNPFKNATHIYRKNGKIVRYDEAKVKGGGKQVTYTFYPDNWRNLKYAEI